MAPSERINKILSQYPKANSAEEYLSDRITAVIQYLDEFYVANK